MLTNKNYYATNNNIIIFNQMEEMFRKHLNDYVIQNNHNHNKNIKYVIHLDDFYDLLSSKKHKGYMQIYERKMYAYKNPNATVELIKSNRKIPNYLFEIINDELIKITNNFKNNDKIISKCNLLLDIIKKLPIAIPISIQIPVAVPIQMTL